MAYYLSACALAGLFVLGVSWRCLTDDAFRRSVIDWLHSAVGPLG